MQAIHVHESKVNQSARVFQISEMDEHWYYTLGDITKGLCVQTNHAKRWLICELLIPLFNICHPLLY